MWQDWVLMAAPILGLTANVATQVALFRLLRRGLLKTVVAGFAAGLAVAGGLSLAAELSLPEARGLLGCATAANLAIVAALGYGYFNFIGLGETSRRVRLLREFVIAGRPLTYEEILQRYSGADIVRVRLERLLGNGQIVRRDGRYFIGKPMVLVIARILVTMKVLLLKKRSEFDA